MHQRYQRLAFCVRHKAEHSVLCWGRQPMRLHLLLHRFAPHRTAPPSSPSPSNGSATFTSRSCEIRCSLFEWLHQNWPDDMEMALESIISHRKWVSFTVVFVCHKLPFDSNETPVRVHVRRQRCNALDILPHTHTNSDTNRTRTSALAWWSIQKSQQNIVSLS